jgi:hypothetical protein
MNQLQLNINKAVMEKYGALSPEANFLSELYQKVRDSESLPDSRPIFLSSGEVMINWNPTTTRSNY